MTETDTASDTVFFLDQLVVEDVKNLCALTAETGFFSEEEILIVEELALAAIIGGGKSGYYFLLAVPDRERRDQLLGFACFGPIPCTHGSWHLYWIVVNPSLQGCGFGRRLIAEAEKRVRAQNGRKLFLETSSRRQYLSTQSFYAACGYHIESRLTAYYAPDEDCLIYSKKIK